MIPKEDTLPTVSTWQSDDNHDEDFDDDDVAEMHNPLCLHDDHEGSDDDHDHFDEKDDVDDDPRAGSTISSWKQKKFSPLVCKTGLKH